MFGGDGGGGINQYIIDVGKREIQPLSYAVYETVESLCHVLEAGAHDWELVQTEWRSDRDFRNISLSDRIFVMDARKVEF